MQRANKNILRNYVRQWRVGRINGIQIYQRFDEVLEKAIEFREVRNKYPKFIKKYELDNFKAYEKLLADTQSLIEEGKGLQYFQGVGAYKKAIHNIEKAINTRTKIQKGIQALNRLEEAKRMYKDLQLKIDSLWLKRMPTYSLLEKLIKKAESFIKLKSTHRRILY